MNTYNSIFDRLMKFALDSSKASRLREKSLLKVYYLYEKEHGSDKGWMKFYEFLRKKHSRKLSNEMLKKYGLVEKDLKKAASKLKKLIGSHGPLTYYSSIYALIYKLSKKGDLLFEIGYGDKPLFINKLNKEGYKCYGIEPKPKQLDNKFSFKAKIQNLPKEVKKEYDIVFANLVFCASYMNYFKGIFVWERKNKLKLLLILANLIKSKGYLILNDDIGSFFMKKQLQRYFNVLIHEKDIGGNTLTLCKRK